MPSAADVEHQRHAARALLEAVERRAQARPPAAAASGRLAPAGTSSRWRSCSSSVACWPCGGGADRLLHHRDRDGLARARSGTTPTM